MKELTLTDLAKRNIHDPIFNHPSNDSEDPIGFLEYKGFIAFYRPGETYRNMLYGRIINLSEYLGVLLEGEGFEGFVSDFRGAVEDVLDNLDSGYLSKPIEDYTGDPVIIDYYRNHHKKKMIDNINFGIQDFINLHETIYANQELAMRGR